MMRIKCLLLLLVFMGLGATAQQSSLKTYYNNMVRNYMDSLLATKTHLDSTEIKAAEDSRYSQLFTTLTFYHRPTARKLRIGSRFAPADSTDRMIDNVLMNIYLKRPDLVREHETHLDIVGAPIESKPEPEIEHVYQEIVEQVAPKAIEPVVKPLDIYVKKPNFWTFSGDYYLQFLQNYVSGNWYKGGESNYSLLGSVTMQANYNNKQKVKWDNKLELKLGLQHSNSDSLHSMKSSEDLIRYTSKLGLQTTKRWYYSLQLIVSTQFTRGFKSNDPKIYSGFMSPFNTNISVGMDYNVNWLNNRLTGNTHIAPLAMNWRYVDRGGLATDYGLDPGSHNLIDYGSEITVDVTWKFSDDISWKCRLYGYTTYERSELEWENTFTFRFNRYISTNLFVYPRFDDGVARDSHHGYWQFKEYCSIGFSYSF